MANGRHIANMDPLTTLALLKIIELQQEALDVIRDNVSHEASLLVSKIIEGIQ